MITISTRDYTTEQLKHIVSGLCHTQEKIFKSVECEYMETCIPVCKAYAICRDVSNALYYVNKKIKEREALELHRDTQESK